MAASGGGFSSHCSIDGCSSVVVARGWCNKHYLRWRYNGDPTALVKPRVGRLTYNTAHYRVYAARGKAAEQGCVDCGSQAEHWSFTRSCPDSSSDTMPWNGKDVRVEYCGHPEHYEARCRSCHTAYDHWSVRV